MKLLAQRIFLLNAWKETELLTDATYAHAEKLFDEHYIAQIIMAVATINAWNRIAISTKRTVK